MYLATARYTMIYYGESIHDKSDITPEYKLCIPCLGAARLGTLLPM